MRFHQGMTSFTKHNYVDTCTLGNAQLIFYSQSLKMLVNAYQHLFWPYTLNRSFHDLSLRAPLSGQAANGRPKLLVLRDKNRGGGRHFSIPIMVRRINVSICNVALSASFSASNQALLFNQPTF